MNRERTLTALSYIYYAIAVATFKHSAWAFGAVLEGLPPELDWATVTFDLVGVFAIAQLLAWYFWGGLMALAVDVGMIFIAKTFRVTSEDGFTWREDGLLIGAYLVVALVSGFTQFYYAAFHTAPLGTINSTIPTLQPGGILYQALQYAVIVLPPALPGMSILYTLATRNLKAQLVHKPGKMDSEKGERVFNVKDAALYTNYSEGWIRQQANKGSLGYKNPETNAWEFTETELKLHKRA